MWFVGRSRNGKERKGTSNQIDVKNKLPVKKVKPVINVEDTKKHCDEFSEKIYFGDTGDESDSESSDIDFVI